MTDREKAIVMAYTGVSMFAGDKLDIFYKYLAELFDRPVFSHELASDEMTEAIKEKAYADFIKLCRETTDPIKHGHWIETSYGSTMWKCSECSKMVNFGDLYEYCGKCGAKMDESEENENG